MQYSVPQLTTNTNNGQIIQVILVLQTQSQQVLTTVTDSQARVNNAIIHALNNVSSTIIDQPGGTALLAQRVQTALQVVAPISRVYFSQLLIQRHGLDGYQTGIQYLDMEHQPYDKLPNHIV